MRLGRGDELLRESATQAAETRKHEHERHRRGRVFRDRVGHEEERCGLAASETLCERRTGRRARGLPARVERRRDPRVRRAHREREGHHGQQHHENAPHALTLDRPRLGEAPRWGHIG